MKIYRYTRERERERVPFLSVDATSCRDKKGKKKEKKCLQRRLQRSEKLFINFNFNILARVELAAHRLFFQMPKSASVILVF